MQGSTGCAKRSRRATEREAHNVTQRLGLLWQQVYTRLLWVDDPKTDGVVTGALRARPKDDGKARVSGSQALKGSFAMHTNWVSAVAYSPDGSRIVSGSGDNTVKIWDAASGTELATFTGHTEPVSGVVWSPDGSRIVSGSWDKTLKIWDAASGAELARITGHRAAVNAVAYSPDGSRIVSGSSDKTLKIWDAASGKRLATLSGHKDAVNAVACSPDGTRIVSASGTYWENYFRAEDEALMVWDASSAKKLALLTGHRNVVRAVAYSPDSSRIISGSDDWTVRVWDAASGAELAAFLGHKDAVGGVAYSPDGSRIVSGSYDNTLKVWDANTFTESHTFHHAPDGVELATLSGHTDGVYAIACSPDGSRIASGSGDRTLRLWDAHTLEPCEASRAR